MDAKVDGVPITPRHGKAVEIQALWVNALRRAAHWADLAGDTERGARHTAAATLAEASFRRRFWRPDLGWLADVVDGPGGDELALRPNQLLALSLPHPLVDEAVGRAILDVVERHLVVPGALRSLAPFEPGYCRSFQGPPAVRDAAYHQGTAWTWLVGPWVDAVARFRGEAAAREAAETALDALDPERTGAIPELLEPEPPHEARGCPWQAWGVAELLRVRRRWSA
jgi:predicted glycogen debranching enzyme